VNLGDTLNLITKISEYAGAPLVVLIAIRWVRLSMAQRFFGLLIIAIFTNQMLASSFLGLFPTSNLPLYHVYLLIEGPGLLLLFRYRFKEKRIRKGLKIGAISLFVLTIANTIFLQDLDQLPSNIRTLESLTMCFLSLFYFRYVFIERKVRQLDKSFWFWVNAGILLYFTSNLLLFMFTNLLLNRDDKLFLGVWTIHASLNFLLYGCYAIGFLCQDQESSYSSSRVH